MIDTDDETHGSFGTRGSRILGELLLGTTVRVPLCKYN